jgi:hypothetical protein
MNKYGLYEKTIPIPYRYNIVVGFLDISTREQVPVPVQACADQKVGCIFFSHRKIKLPPIPAPLKSEIAHYDTACEFFFFFFL